MKVFENSKREWFLIGALVGIILSVVAVYLPGLIVK